MKLTPDDLLKLRSAFAACKLGGMDHAVITGGMICSISDGRNAAIYSPLELSIDPTIKLAILRLKELDKRLSLFGEDVLIEGELTAENKVRKLLVRGKQAKMEFRCTDVAMFDSQNSAHKYPKANRDQPSAVLTFSKPEISMISKAVRSLGGEQITLQVKRGGLIHLESVDSSSDRFEMDLTQPAAFVDEPTSSVASYLCTSEGFFLSLLEQVAKEAQQEACEVVLMKTGNVQFHVHRHNVIAIPRIETGTSNG